MSKKVIGYHYELHEKVLEHSKMSSDEFVGSTVQLCFGRVNEPTKIKEEDSSDIIDQMINQNIGKIVEVNGNIAKIMLKYPIPEEIFKQYYDKETPIYE